MTLLHVLAENATPEVTQAAQFFLEPLALVARYKPKIRIVQINNKNVSQQILELDHDFNIGLIVLGTHGRQGIARLKLGSVAQAVAGIADIPVQIIPSDQRLAQDFATRWKEATAQQQSL